MSANIPVHVAIPAALSSYIATRDKRIAKCQWNANPPLREAFYALLSKGVVKMGGRATCGGAVDPTWVAFTAWNEVVRKAVKLGFRITVTPVKHGNGWATKARGFWDENEYVLEPTP